MTWICRSCSTAREPRAEGCAVERCGFHGKPITECDLRGHVISYLVSENCEEARGGEQR